MKPIVMYRRTLDVRSGVGQLVHALAVGLRAVGARVRLTSRRGGWRYFVRTGWPVRRVSESGAHGLCEADAQFVIDHEMELPRADLVFAHGLIAEATRMQPRADWNELRMREADFFRGLSSAVPIITCSALMKSALIEHYAVAPERIRVHYPGYRADVFAASRVLGLRGRARARLGLGNAVPLVGFVTSGDFQTRGLDIFLAAAERIHRQAPATRFLVVGSKTLPDWAQRHALVAAGHVFHRAKSGRPELWMSALDIFLYPSRFDAFGIVVAEAQALGIPILTSRRVGAAECLPTEYAPWLSDVPDGELLAARCLELLDDTDARNALAAVGAAHIVEFGRERYVAECIATICDQNV